ncbi:MAG: class I SAM-dependent methyltransferase [Vicinamibacterales bacterium]
MDLRTKKYFEDHAAKFDSLYHEGRPLERRFNRFFRKAIYERFAITFDRSEPIVGKSVLDVGCGSGRYSLEYARRGAARVLGVDFSAPMLGIARQLATEQGVADRCEFRQVDFTEFSIDERFDVVIAIGFFDYQAQPVEVLRRMVAHSRGRVIASFPGRSLIRMPLRKARYWLDNCPVLFYREEEVRQIARDAGVRQVDIVPIHSSGTGYVLVGDV